MDLERNNSARLGGGTRNRTQINGFVCPSYLRELEESNPRPRFWRPLLYHLTKLPITSLGLYPRILFSLWRLFNIPDGFVALPSRNVLFIPSGFAGKQKSFIAVFNLLWTFYPIHILNYTPKIIFYPLCVQCVFCTICRISSMRFCVQLFSCFSASSN